MQWHPLFAELLRPLLRDYYEIRTDVPVGELPREADLVLLRRTAPAPFVGIWRHLTAWNVFEFKGPSDTTEVRDLDLLLEVGLGIDRKLNEEQRRQGQPPGERVEVSWWYLANHVGSRFRAAVEQLLRVPLELLGPGLWRCPALGRTLVLVSRDLLPVDAESVPLHLVTEEPVEREQALARVVAREPGLWELYGTWLARLHPNALKEIGDMIQSPDRELTAEDLRPVIAAIGLKGIIDLFGLKQVIDQLELKQVIDQVGLQQVIDQVGLKQVIDQVGVEQVLKAAGPGEIVALLNQGQFLAQLTPGQIQELIQVLQRRLP